MIRTCLFAAILMTGSAVSVFASVDQQLLSMAPPETTLLTGIDIARTSASPFGQHVLADAPAQDAQFQEFMTVTGFDPRRDLQHVLLAGIAGKQGPDSRFAVLARGSFNIAKLETAAQAHGLKLSTANGTRLLLGTNGGKQMAFAFPQPDIAVMGDPETVREILSNSGNGAAPDPKLMQQVNEIGPANDIWFATLLSGNFIQTELPSNAAPQVFNAQVLRSIVQSSGGVQFGSTVSVAVHLVTKSDADAQSVSDLLKFASNLLQSKQGDDPHLSAIAAALSTMEVQTAGPRVNANFAIDEKLLEHFIQGPAHLR